MPNFMQRLASIPGEAQAVREAIQFSKMERVTRAGVDVSNAGLGLSRSDKALRLRNDPRWLEAVAACGNLFHEVYTGKRPAWHAQEAMTTSDFPLLFGDLLYRQLLGNYAPYPVTYPQYMRIVDVKDFRKLNLYTLDGGQGTLTPVGEREPYPEIAFTENRYQVAVQKYGRRYGVSFEMMINDDLNAFQQRPLMMATGARRSEELLATQMLCDVNGPHASFFTSGNKNIVTANPVLSTQGLQTAFKVLAAQKDADGQPIIITAVNLVVAPQDEITAQNILHASQLRINGASGGGTTDQFLYVENWMRAKVTLSVNPYIPIVASSASTMPWFLIANPNDLNSRPAFVFAFMQGRRNPQLFLKDPDAMNLGGGNIDATEGSFDTDQIDYKLRHIFGATQVDPKMAVASSSAGS